MQVLAMTVYIAALRDLRTWPEQLVQLFIFQVRSNITLVFVGGESVTLSPSEDFNLEL